MISKRRSPPRSGDPRRPDSSRKQLVPMMPKGMATASLGSAVHDLRDAEPRGRLPFAVYFVFLVLIFVVSAAASVVYVQLQSSRDARAQARSAATFAAAAASKQLGEQIGLLRATVSQLASNPGITQA